MDGKTTDQTKTPATRSKKARTAKSSSFSPTDDGRHKVLHDYHDHSQVSFSSEFDAEQALGHDKRKGPRGGVTVPFPTKLHIMLSKVEENGLSHIVSWQPHGRCFVVHKPKEFVSEVMPEYFRQSKLTSFQRQLNLYGFARITTGRDRGGYYHELFLKHKLFLCQKMARIRIKGTGIKGKASPETEPDFYSMPWINPEDASFDFDRHIEDEVAVALQEDIKRSEPTRQRSPKRQDSGKKKQAAKKRSAKKDVLDIGTIDCSSPRCFPAAGNAPAAVTPDTVGSKRRLSFPSLFDLGSTSFTFQRRASQNRAGDQEQFIDLCPQLLSSSSDSEDSNDDPHSGDEIMFEGQHFHYLDSFAAPAPPFSLAPRSAAIEHHPRIVESLRDPILTPSSSSHSLNEMSTFKQDDSLEINPETIFSDEGAWTIGENVDIDAELALLGK